jgi:DNA repair protein RadC
MHVELSEEQKIKVMNSADVYSVMQQILLRESKIERDYEHLYVVGLAANNRIIYIELVSLGAINHTVVEPMQVFRVGILKGAVQLILVHNHPSAELDPPGSDLQPSEPDNDMTDRMIQVGKIVNIRVIDHLVISTKSYYSYQESGLLARLELSKKWVPRYQEEERIRKEALKIGEQKGIKKGKQIGLEKGLERGIKKGKKEGLKEGEKKGKKEGLKEGEERGIQKGRTEGEKKKALAMARSMKKNGESIEKISLYNGLSKKEIERL